MNVLVLQPATGQSLIINLATGLASTNASSSLSATNGGADPNWLVSPGQAAQVVLDSSVAFNPAWLINGPTSNWIAVSATTLSANAGSATRNFTRTFTLLSGLDPTTLRLSGQVACDKSCSVYLNGQLLVSVTADPSGGSSYMLQDWPFFATPAQLVVGGLNTLIISLSTVNTTSDSAAQYSGVRLEGYVNAALVSSVRGDPQLVGLLGQSYQVHGMDGAVYNLISDASVQLNSRFSFLTGGECLRDEAGRPLFTCWTHPRLVPHRNGAAYQRRI